MTEISGSCPITEFCDGNSGIADDFILEHFEIFSKEEINNILIPLCMAVRVIMGENNCPMLPIFHEKLKRDGGDTWEIWGKFWTKEEFKKLGLLPQSE